MLIVQGLFAMTLRGRVRKVLAGVDGPTRDLVLLRGLLTRLEAEPVSTPRLQQLEAALRTEGLPPSRRIAQLQRLADLLDARRNQFFAPFGLLLLWSTQLALAVESWRVHYGPALAGWLRAAGEMEALAALAGYAYEHPDDVFPELVDDGPVLEGRALGHPLLPEDRCVRNDLHLGTEPRALVISGSNMSGKSTYLRTAGCNALLAFAGAPVRAEALRISPLAIGASLQIADNLREGTSHFYAEIRRLRGVMDLTEGAQPVLFLLDEILHGTNSHDRRIGASAVVRQLVERGCLGLVTTHDLALAKIADELAPRILNVHFQDHLEDGRMCFDYTLQPGVVSKSNALELMRSVGLEVS
jgi:DNA mismatch repair ATPase MutS